MYIFAQIVRTGNAELNMEACAGVVAAEGLAL